MIHGLFLDPRTWKIDFLPSPFWCPEKYGIKIDLHNDAFKITKTGVDKKYKFVIATEVWEIPMQKTLQYLKNKGLKIFLVPREISPTRSHLPVMFNHEKFKYKNNYYFTPDLVLSTNKQYSELWQGRAKAKTIGYPRFDIYLDKTNWKTKEQIIRRHGIEKDKKIIFFPSYPPYGIQNVNGKNVTIDLSNDLQATLEALKQYAIKNKDVQIISKIHPMAFKCYIKKIGNGNEVSGLLKQYYENPTNYMKVIGDIREDGSVAREMVMVSDIIVGYTSIMMLEAMIIDKPVLHLNFEQCRQLKDSLEFHNDIYTINSADEMENALSDMNKLLSYNKTLIDKYLYKIDGKFCERLCKTILEEYK